MFRIICTIAKHSFPLMGKYDTKYERHEKNRAQGYEIEDLSYMPD